MVHSLSYRGQSWRRYHILGYISPTIPRHKAYCSDSTLAVSVLSDTCSPHHFDSGTPLLSGLDHHIYNIALTNGGGITCNLYAALVGILIRRPFLLLLLPLDQSPCDLLGLVSTADQSIVYPFWMLLSIADCHHPAILPQRCTPEPYHSRLQKAQKVSVNRPGRLQLFHRAVVGAQ